MREGAWETSAEVTNTSTHTVITDKLTCCTL